MAKKAESKLERRINFILILVFQAVALLIAGIAIISMVINSFNVYTAYALLVVAVFLLALSNLQVTLQFWRHYHASDKLNAEQPDPEAAGFGPQGGQPSYPAVQQKPPTAGPATAPAQYQNDYYHAN